MIHALATMPIVKTGYDRQASEEYCVPDHPYEAGQQSAALLRVGMNPDDDCFELIKLAT